MPCTRVALPKPATGARARCCGFAKWQLVLLPILLFGPPTGVLAGDNSWTSLGPDGDICDIKFSPSDPQVVYAASSSGRGVYKSGVYKSSDGGGSWAFFGIDAQCSLFHSSLAIDATNPQEVYFGWGGEEEGFAAGFVYKSTNGGNDWTELSLPWVGGAAMLEADPTTPRVIYALTDGDEVRKSTNGGNSWAAVNTGLPERDVAALAIAPSDARILYAGGGRRIYKSTNGGGSWAACADLPARADPFALEAAPSDPLVVYAIASWETVTSVYKTTNGGGSWALANTGLPQDHYYPTDIAIDPLSSQVLYTIAYYGEVYKSSNGGGGWAEVGSYRLPDSALGVCLAIDPSNPQVIYAGTADGLYVLTQSTGNRPPVLEPIGPITVRTGVEGGALLRASDEDYDQLTYQVSGEPPGFYISPSQFTTTYAFFTGQVGPDGVGTYTVTFTVSDGHGGTDSETVTLTVTGDNRAPVLAPVGDLTVAEGDSLTIVLNATDEDGDALYYDAIFACSPSSCLTFATLTGSVFSGRSGFGDVGTYEIFFSVSDGHGGLDYENVTLTVTQPSPTTGLLVRAMVGSNRLTSPAEIVVGRRVVIEVLKYTHADQADSTAVAAFSLAAPSSLGAVSGNAIRLTTLAGKTGTLTVSAEGATAAFTITTTHSTMDHLVIQPQEASLSPGERVDFNAQGTDSYGNVFPLSGVSVGWGYWPATLGSISASTGLFTAGATGGEGCVIAVVSKSLRFGYGDASTTGTGRVVVAAARPNAFALHQNSPNPFNPETTIRFDLAESRPVRLEFYDTVGRLVRVLIDEPLSAGTHTVLWDGTGNDGAALSSGVYLVRLAAGDFVSVRKALLLR